MLVKICGLTRAEDAVCADKEGADLLGLVFAKSPRQVTVEQAQKIIEAVGKPEKFVAVFVDETFENISKIVQDLSIPWVQLHGSETPEIAQNLGDLGVHTIKAVPVQSRLDIDLAFDYPCDALLFDTYDKSKKGGTGEVFNWNLLKEGRIAPRYFLSGGLSIDNIKDAYETLQPSAIDVSSSLEDSPGIKNKTKIKKFLNKVKNILDA